MKNKLTWVEKVRWAWFLKHLTIEILWFGWKLRLSSMNQTLEILSPALFPTITICPNSDKFNSNPSTVQECSSWSHLPQIVTFLWLQTDICGSGGEHIYTHIIPICFLDYLNRHRFCVENLLCCALILYWNSFIFISFFNDDIILL